jgi:hypothetical protein
MLSEHCAQHAQRAPSARLCVTELSVKSTREFWADAMIVELQVVHVVSKVRECRQCLAGPR